MYEAAGERKPRGDKSGGYARTFLEMVSKKTTPALGIAVTIPSIVVAQHVGVSGSEFAFIDMEHSPLSAEMTTHLVHSIVASSRGSCFPLVRVPSHGVEWIKWALDSGASGIILPMINNKHDIEVVIEKALFPPRGKRSFGPAMAPWGLPDGPHGGVSAYFQRALEGQIALLPMIESKEGLENAEEILATEGVSGVFIGPMDLRLSLGLGGGDGLEPEYIQALAKVCSLSKRYNKVVGSLSMDATTARRRAGDGMNFLVVSADVIVIDTGFQKALEVANESVQQRDKSSL